MSKERASRRAARELDRLMRVSAAEERHRAKRRREDRRERRREMLTPAIQPGYLAARRRVRMRIAALVLILFNGAVWVSSNSYYVRFGAILLSALIMPIVRVLIVNRRD